MFAKLSFLRKPYNERETFTQWKGPEGYLGSRGTWHACCCCGGQTAPPPACVGNCCDWSAQEQCGVTIKISDSGLRNIDVSFRGTTSVSTFLTGNVLVRFECISQWTWNFEQTNLWYKVANTCFANHSARSELKCEAFLDLLPGLSIWQAGGVISWNCAKFYNDNWVYLRGESEAFNCCLSTWYSYGFDVKKLCRTEKVVISWSGLASASR